MLPHETSDSWALGSLSDEPSKRIHELCLSGRARRMACPVGRMLFAATAIVIGWTPLPASSAERMRYIHTDALGSPVAETDAQGLLIDRLTYEPYGAVVGSSLDAGPAFAGHVNDTMTGLTYMQQRYLDTDLGVFLSVDPVGPSIAPVGMFNRYRYANGNPYTFYDPDGRCTGSRITNGDGTCQISGGMTTVSTTASAGRSGAEAVSVPDSIKMESQGYRTAGDAAKAAGSEYGKKGVESRRELQLGLTEIKVGEWGYLTPGWGPEKAKIVDPRPLLRAYISAGFKVDAWMHGHFDSNLNFSANDFALVWGGGAATFMVNKNGAVRMLNDSHLQSALRRLPFEVRKRGLSGLKQYYSNEGLPGDEL
jgi:RHS repeat-associated protein